MTSTPPFDRDDCPTKPLGIDPDGCTYHFLNNNSEHIALTEDQLRTDEGLCTLFTKVESLKWARRRWPAKNMH